jgi:DDE_Tnp_1-associated
MASCDDHHPSPPCPSLQHPCLPPSPTARIRRAHITPEHGRDLLAALASLTDPRARRGRRHLLVSVLAVAVAAMLAGHRSLAAIAAWAHDAPQPVLTALGACRNPLTGRAQPPGEATIRRILKQHRR